jgi:hypothetical protein
MQVKYQNGKTSHYLRGALAGSTKWGNLLDQDTLNQGSTVILHAQKFACPLSLMGRKNGCKQKYFLPQELTL